LSPTQRTLAYLRERGWKCRVVEHWNQFARKRQDLWGADIAAIHPKIDYPLLVQTTSAANIAARQKKVAEIPEAKIWLSFGAYMVQGWTKGGRNINRFAVYEDGKIIWCDE
jgi:hypothetical protein